MYHIKYCEVAINFMLYFYLYNYFDLCLRMPNRIKVMNFNDTFLNKDHLMSSFPNHQITPHENNPNNMLPPYR